MNANEEIKSIKFKVSYAFGGRFKGDHKHEVIVEAIDRDSALIKFKAEYNYEIIYSVSEL